MRRWMAAIAASMAWVVMLVAQAEASSPPVAGRVGDARVARMSAGDRVGFTSPPMVLAHRGASGAMPENTLASMRVAIQEGADTLEFDLVMSKDGALVCRHERQLSLTTDVADHPEFADRRTTKKVAGHSVTDWFVEDFTLAEIKTLRAVERMPELRPQSAAYDEDFRIPTFAEILALRALLSAQAGHAVWVAPELKTPAYFRGLGLRPEETAVAELRAVGLATREAPVIVNSFNLRSMTRLRGLAPVHVARVISGSARLSDWWMKRYATRVDAIFVKSNLLIPNTPDGRLGAPTSVLRRADRVGLDVFAWTFRVENTYLPIDFQIGTDPSAPGNLTGLAQRFADAGADGLITDNPAETVAVRAAS